MEAQRGYVTCLRSHSWHQEKPACGRMCVYICAQTLHTLSPHTLHSHLPFLGSLHSGKGFYSPWVLEIWARFLGKKAALRNSTFISVISEAFPAPSQGAPRSPICLWRLYLEAGTKSREDMTSAMPSCLKENRPVYFSSPESKGFPFVLIEAIRFLLEKLSGKMYNHCRYSSFVRSLCL